MCSLYIYSAMVWNGIDGSPSRVSNRWDWLGPFSVAVGERGVDAISFETSHSNETQKQTASYEYTNKLPTPDKKSYASELVLGGKVGWTKVIQC